MNEENLVDMIILLDMCEIQEEGFNCDPYHLNSQPLVCLFVLKCYLGIGSLT